MENLDIINKKQGEIIELKSYLYSTDYMVIKSYETGEFISEEVKSNREAYRLRINQIEAEILELQSQQIHSEEL